MSERQRELYCKLCGVQVDGRRQGDFDATQYHAFLFHPELTEIYNPVIVRKMIEKGEADRK